jgi:hypothetical protein
MTGKVQRRARPPRERTDTSDAYGCCTIPVCHDGSNANAVRHNDLKHACKQIPKRPRLRLVHLFTQVPLEEFISKLTALVSFFKEKHGSDVLLLTPSTCNPDTFLAFLRGRGIAIEDTGKSNETSRQYADAVLQVGKETGSPAIDLYDLFEKHQREGVKDKELFTDGLHYTPKAYRVSLTPPYVRRGRQALQGFRGGDKPR